MRNGSDNTYQAERAEHKRRLRILKYWGIQILELAGCSIAFAVAMMVLQLLTSGSEIMDTMPLGLLFPIYLLVIGAVTIMVFGISLFQVYFPTLVSLNVTRKSAAGSIVLAQGAASLVLMLLAAALWGIGAKKSGAETMGLLMLFTGIFFIIVALGILFGIVLIRWGKIGVILLVLIFAAAGGVLGFFVASVGGDVIVHMQSWLIEDAAGKNFFPVFGAGVLSYVISGVLAVFMTRKAEVRV